MKLFTPNRNYAAIIVTLLFVIFFGAVYFFIYLPHNEKRIQEQRFRTLQHIDKNVHDRIKNSIDQINNLLGSYHKEITVHDKKIESGKATVGQYVDSLPTESFVVSRPVVPLKVGKDTTITDGYSVRINNQNREIRLDVRRVIGDSVYRMSMRYT